MITPPSIEPPKNTSSHDHAAILAEHLQELIEMAAEVGATDATILRKTHTPETVLVIKFPGPDGAQDEITVYDLVHDRQQHLP